MLLHGSLDRGTTAVPARHAQKSDRPASHTPLRAGADVRSRPSAAMLPRRHLRSNTREGSAMARGINKVILIGNLGADPETRAMPSGITVANLRIATSESWKDKQSGEQQGAHRVAHGRAVRPPGRDRRRVPAQGLAGLHRGPLRTRKWQDKTGQRSLHHRNRRQRHADARRPWRRPAGVAGAAAAAPGTPGGAASGRGREPCAASIRDSGDAPAPSAEDDFDDDIPF